MRLRRAELTGDETLGGDEGNRSSGMVDRLERQETCESGGTPEWRTRDYHRIRVSEIDKWVADGWRVAGGRTYGAWVHQVWVYREVDGGGSETD